ncbi:ABC transporter ATP-binding protein [Ancylobacter sp.]|uniref:ABC transporter ATP-binding protein n=1 Tax=Ancylobacter sp. TaxID=1872567 RepID=UPI003BABE6FF
MLDITGLRAGYGAHEVLQGLSMRVGKGQVVALLGGNGAGKTTTLSAIMGLIPSQGGEIAFEGNSIQGQPAHRVFRHGLSLVPQWRELFTDMSVQEHLELGAIACASRGDLDARVASALDYFPELRAHLARRAGTLSGGQQQMVAIARALTARPKLLMLDEPSMGLAPLVVRELGRTIKRLNEAGTSVLLVEQNMHLALGVASYVYVIRAGTIITHGPTGDFHDEKELFHSYIG